MRFCFFFNLCFQVSLFNFQFRMSDLSKSGDKKRYKKITSDKEIVIFSGDFRQGLPIVEFGSREEITAQIAKNFDYWSSISKFKLMKNLRLGTGQTYFTQYLLNIGEDTAPKNENGEIEVDSKLIFEDSERTLTRKIVYPEVFDEEFIRRQKRIKLEETFGKENMETDQISAEFISDFNCESLSDIKNRFLFVSDFVCESLPGTEDKQKGQCERFIIPEKRDEVYEFFFDGDSGSYEISNLKKQKIEKNLFIWQFINRFSRCFQNGA